MTGNDSCSTGARRDDAPAGGGPPMTLSVVPDVSGLAPLRRRLSSEVEPDLDDDAVQMYLIAITEALTNAIEAHRHGGVDESITVTIDRAGRTVTIEDRAGPWTTDGRGGPVIPDAPPGLEAGRGRGLLIMRSICPDMRISETSHGTRVELPYPR